MKRIIVNGANGYVASNFINQLLMDDYEVVALVRGSVKMSAEDRVYTALSEINGGVFDKEKRLKVCSYSLTDENFALTDEQLQDIFKGAFDYYHFAASLKYDLKSKDQIFATNIEGVKNSLEVYKKYSNDHSRFFFISTAYSCGNREGLFQEKFYDNEDISCFRNYYEQSKRFAENVIKDALENEGVKAHIIRLSQVVGNSDTGVTNTDYGIFDFAKRMYGLAHRYPNETVRLKVDPQATQNLIPINTVVRYLMKTVQLEKVPGIMNFIAKQSVKNSHIIGCVTELMPINIVPVEELEKEDMTSIERLVSVGMSFTGRYVDTRLSFDTRNLESIISVDDHITDEESITKMLSYFVDSLSVDKKKKPISVAS